MYPILDYKKVDPDSVQVSDVGVVNGRPSLLDDIPGHDLDVVGILPNKVVEEGVQERLSSSNHQNKNVETYTERLFNLGLTNEFKPQLGSTGNE